MRRMDHRHAVFDRDRLATAQLHVDIAARQNRKDQRLFAVDQMTAVELGADSNGQLQPPHPPSPMKTLARPSTIAWTASTTRCPRARGGSKPNTFFI